MYFTTRYASILYSAPLYGSKIAMALVFRSSQIRLNWETQRQDMLPASDKLWVLSQLDQLGVVGEAPSILVQPLAFEGNGQLPVGAHRSLELGDPGGAVFSLPLNRVMPLSWVTLSKKAPRRSAG
jgi:hypothetical protein